MSRIEITFLGTSAGIPTRKRSHPAIYLSYIREKEFCYLFDCGEGTQRQMLFAGLNFMKINQIFITHWHGDHYLGLPGLIDTMSFEGRVRPLTIYSTEPGRTKNFISEGCTSLSFEVIFKSVPVKGEQVKNLLETDDFEIVSVPVRHTIPAVAYAIIEKDRVKIDREKLKSAGLPAKGEIYGEIKKKGKVVVEGKEVKLKDICLLQKGKKVVYSGDTRVCDNLMKIAQGADLLIQDCTYFDGENFEEYEHASVGDVVNLLNEIDVKRVILTHISRRYKDQEELRKKVEDYPNVEIAEDFMKVTI